MCGPGKQSLPCSACTRACSGSTPGNVWHVLKQLGAFDIVLFLLTVEHGHPNQGLHEAPDIWFGSGDGAHRDVVLAAEATTGHDRLRCFDASSVSGSGPAESGVGPAGLLGSAGMDTTVGIVHYGKSGFHVVPARPVA